jgi:hypothetical protein
MSLHRYVLGEHDAAVVSAATKFCHVGDATTIVRLPGLPVVPVPLRAEGVVANDAAFVDEVFCVIDILGLVEMA